MTEISDHMTLSSELSDLLSLGCKLNIYLQRTASKLATLLTHTPTHTRVTSVSITRVRRVTRLITVSLYFT